MRFDLRQASLLTIALLGACGDDGGTKPSGNVDAPPNVPAMVTVTGKAEEISAGGRDPQADVMIAAYKEGDSTPVAMTTSGADGNYTLTIPTNGEVLDGYVLAKKSGYKDTYLYPPAPISADLAGASVLLVTQSTFDFIPGVASAQQDPGMGFVALLVVDAQQNPVEGAVVTATPTGMIRYNSGGFPNRDATATDTDGTAYIFNLPAGDVTLSATKAGSTFHGHKVNARADQFTTTLIQ